MLGTDAEHAPAALAHDLDIYLLPAKAQHR
jgi:hypothetical protein